MAEILIVEDEPSVVAFLERALTGAGYSVSSARNGTEGIARARLTRPNLVIMDMSMPKLDGWAATRALKADPITQHIPVMALTSAISAGDRDAAYEAGCDGYETKPIDLARLLERVKELAGS